MVIQNRSGLLEKPSWITVPDIKLQRVRSIITRDFWDHPSPLTQDAYLEIGFPISFGSACLAGINDIYTSNAYLNIQNGPRLLSEKKFSLLAGSKLPVDVQFIEKLCRQMMEADYYIFQQDRVSWDFVVDIQQVGQGLTQRGTGLHADSDLGDLDHIKMLADAFKVGGEILTSKYPHHPQTGITRHYVMSDFYPTLFKGHSPFNPLEFVLYIAEEHESPVMPRDCIRFFLRGKATPV